MHAVILAAGLGSRLRPVTNHRPKPCVTVGRRPILAHQIHAYATAGIDAATVVAGYRAADVGDLCTTLDGEYEDLDITVIENGAYDSTDNMYSLSLASEAVGRDGMVLTNGDVVFEPAVMQRLLDADVESAIACDTSVYHDESMKITLDGEGRVDHIAKTIDPQQAHGTSIDAYRFSAEFTHALFDDIDRRIASTDDGGWTEVAIDSLLDHHRVDPVDIARHDWVEIDDHDDLSSADRRFSALSALSERDAVFFDLDGTIYLGDELIEGAGALIAALRERGVAVRFLSNNSSAWKTDYADKLRGLGVPADPTDVILSTDGVLAYLAAVDAEGVYVLGTEAMRDAIADHGFDVEADHPEYVVVGFDTELTYQKAAEASLAIRDGAQFLLAHPDLVCPTPEGPVPDCGSIGALVEAATGEKPARTFGKPSTEMIDHVLDEKALDPADVVVVGDRLETEMRMAERIGCESVCVLTGDATRGAIEESLLHPTLVTDDVGDLLEFL
jgi:HAD superfamily hydrolase (TIGR01450 family)